MSTDDVESKTYTPKYLNRYTNAQYDYLFKNGPVPEDKVIQSEEESEFEFETGVVKRERSLKEKIRTRDQYYRLKPPLIDATSDNKRIKTEEEPVFIKPPTVIPPDSSKNLAPIK